MKPFFKTLSQYKIKQIEIQIAFDFENNAVSILTAPKSPATDKATHQLPELVIHNDIETIDQNFFEILQKPLEKTQEFFDNTLAFEKELELQKKQTQAEELKKNTIKKLEDSIAKIKEKTDFNYSKYSNKILKIIDEIKTIDPNNKNASKEHQTLLEQTQIENTLFEQ